MPRMEGGVHACGGVFPAPGLFTQTVARPPPKLYMGEDWGQLKAEMRHFHGNFDAVLAKAGGIGPSSKHGAAEANGDCGQCL